MENNKTPQNPREIDIFNRHSHGNKFKIMVISIVIAVVFVMSIFFLTKAFLTYTVTYHLDGGHVLGETMLADDKYGFLQKTVEPKNIKKTGYYIAGYYTDPEFKKEFTFGKAIWKSKDIYIKWEDGYAVQLYLADGDNPIESGIDEQRLKIYHEQYVKPGTEYQLPLVFNDVGGAKGKHKGEQLLWYLDSECTGNPFETQNFQMNKDYQIYGRWFDITADHYDVDENGVLERYLGDCSYLKLPDNIKKIKDIEGEFVDELWDSTTIQSDHSHYSAFDKVLSSLKQVYLNPGLQELGARSFRSCSALEMVVFVGDNVTRIGKEAFFGCSLLDYINIPASVTSIEDSAFNNSHLKYFSGASGVKTIGNEAFASTQGFRQLRFDAVVSIGQLAFGSCVSLKTIILGGDKVVTALDDPTGSNNVIIDAFVGISPLTIYVRDELVASYKNSLAWSNYKNIIRPLSELVEG